jgi:hypothetical protein
MATLDAALAAPAFADVNVELSMDRLAWNLDLVLLLDVGFVNDSAALGTDLGHSGLVGLVDFILRWRRSMPMFAVFVPGLASRLFGLSFGLALGEGGSLTLACAALLVEQLGELLDLGFEFREAFPQHGAFGTRFCHVGSVAKCDDVSCASFTYFRAAEGKTCGTALNNYTPFLGAKE